MLAALTRAWAAEVPGGAGRHDPGAPDCAEPFAFQGTVVNARFSPLLAGDFGLAELVATLHAPGVEDVGSASYAIEIRGPRGGLVRSISGTADVSADAPATVRIPWDGRDSGGYVVPPGVYEARFSASAGTLRSAQTDGIAVVVDPSLTVEAARRLRAQPSADIAPRVNPGHEPMPYLFWYGNPHAHTTRSDGGGSASGGSCTAATARPEGAYPDDAYAIAAAELDWLMVAEHNHLIDDADPYDALAPNGDARGIYAQGRAMADAATGPGFVGIYGMEWGTTTGCGHVALYDAPALLGWEAGSNDVYTPSCGYAGAGGLYDLAARPGAGSPATGAAHLSLCHPSDSDMFDGYARDGFADAAVAGVAVVSGPSTSCATTFPSGGTSQTATFKNRLVKLLDAGWRVAPEGHQDNHGDNFATHSEVRTVVLADRLSRPCLLQAMRERRVYATQDANAQLVFRMAAGNGVPHHMGEEVGGAGGVTLHASFWDPDASSVTIYRILRGAVGDGSTSFSDLDVVASGPTGIPAGPVTIDVSDDRGTGLFYYLVEVQQPGSPNVRHTVSAPIWVDYGIDDDGTVPPPCAPRAAATAAPGSGCGVVTAQLAANASGGVPPYVYAWSPAAGLSDIASATPSAVAAATATYTVVVTDAAGTASAPSPVTVTVGTGVPLPAPENVTARGSVAGIDVSWDAVPGATGYEVYRAAGGCTMPSLVHAQAAGGPERHAFLDAGIAPGVPACYRIVGVGPCSSPLSACGPPACAAAGLAPEVSPGGASVPLTLEANGTLSTARFAWAGSGIVYHLYAAPDRAAIAAGTYATRLCNLAGNAGGTFATDGAAWASFTIPTSSLPSGLLAIVAEGPGGEGPYGFASDGSPRARDLDGDTPDDRGCP